MQNRRPSGSARKSASRGGSRRKSNIDKSNRRLAWILGLAVVAVVVALAFSAHGGDKATATEADGSLEAVITNPDLPEKLKDVIKCRNPRCITTSEQELDQVFKPTDKADTYRCLYCESKEIFN